MYSNLCTLTYVICLQVMSKTRFPRWHKTFELTMPKVLTEQMLKIVVYNRDKFLQDKFMGQVSRSFGIGVSGGVVTSAHLSGGGGAGRFAGGTQI